MGRAIGSITRLAATTVLMLTVYGVGEALIEGNAALGQRHDGLEVEVHAAILKGRLHIAKQRVLTRGHRLTRFARQLSMIPLHFKHL